MSTVRIPKLTVKLNKRDRTILRVWVDAQKREHFALYKGNVYQDGVKEGRRQAFEDGKSQLVARAEKRRDELLGVLRHATQVTAESVGSLNRMLAAALDVPKDLL